MPLTITQIAIHEMFINYNDQYVRVTFSMVDPAGRQWDTKHALFWVTLPPAPGEYDFEIPSGYIPTLAALRDDADAALTARFIG